MFETGINAVPFLFFNSISVCLPGQNSIELLTIEELVTLFKKQLKIHGVSKFVPLLIEVVDGGIQSDLDKEDDCSSEDILSDSGLGSNESSIDGRDSGDSDDENQGTDKSESSDESQDAENLGMNNHNDMIHLHEPPIFRTIHCPPFEDIEITMYGACDCSDFGMIVCGKEDDFIFFTSIDFTGEMNAAIESTDFPDRLPSNLLRKRLYKLLFHATDYGILEKNERRRLPNCAVARIRQTYPSLTGHYMGFKEN